VRSRLAVEATRRERLEQDLVDRYPGLTMREVEATGIDPPLPCVRLRVVGRVPHLAEPLPGGGLRLRPFAPARSLVETLGPKPQRQHPLVCAFPSTEERVLELTLPDGLSPVVLPPATASRVTAADYRLEVSARPGRLLLTQVWRRLQRRLPPEDYAAWRQWLAEVDGAMRAELRLAGPGGAP
jgi:hypothetical protein